MTNAQMNVLVEKLNSLEKRMLQIETIQSKQSELLAQVANNKLDANALRTEIDKLNLVIQSIRDEVEA